MNADIFYFGVHQAVGCFVLLNVGQEGQNDERQQHEDIRKRPGQRRAVAQRVHKAGHQQIQNAHAAHDHQVDDYRPEGPLFHVLNALVA